MQRSPTNLLKHSHTRARTLVMPSLMLSSSTQLEGPYQFTEIDQFCGWPNMPIMQPVQTSLVESYQQISSNSDLSYGPARKKRLTMDQTKSLECSFAMDNKLGPERKKKLAVELGLQPRQVAIWYQNRRARTKTKHLEEKYEALNMQYEDVLKEKKKLEAEVNKLRGELQGLKQRENPGANGNKPNIMQGGNSMSSINNEDASFSTTEVQQQQLLYVQGSRNNQPVCSENNSSESAHNQTSTFSTDSPPACDYKFNQANSIVIKQAFEPQGNMSSNNAPQEANYCPPNHQNLAHPFDNLQLYQHYHQQQKQEQLLQHFQHQYQYCFRNIVGDVKLGSFEYLAIPSTPMAQFNDSNHFPDDYRFKLDDEAAQYLELATHS
ncbi:hypothetical protein GOP47_0007316 [Adiantum capillus-veneris]|uniref:Homeobox domain-containing protein n=1 Tax=Adiantum capillus-veneris TaxID=13818 RepID=A0A9D4V1A9_ADICA|nr:hypothetical protein GOP47_0007316 [Adiantum capillus-veneris]